MRQSARRLIDGRSCPLLSGLGFSISAAAVISTGTNRFMCAVRCSRRWPKAARMRSGSRLAWAL